jgi:hypothetical protein
MVRCVIAVALSLLPMCVYARCFHRTLGDIVLLCLFYTAGGPDVERPRIHHYTDDTFRVLDYIVTISFGCVLFCGCLNLFCNVWVCRFCSVWVCGFCSVWVCGFCSVWACGFCNVWVCRFCNVWVL